MFWKHGFADASLQELEKATGVNKSGLYAEFSGKEELFLESLRFYLDRMPQRELLTVEPLGWDNIEQFLKLGPRNTEGQKGCFAVSSMRVLVRNRIGAPLTTMTSPWRSSSTSVDMLRASDFEISWKGVCPSKRHILSSKESKQSVL